ncbi:MAG: hypothetical protein M3Y50_02475 [Acidobacteriota bacterium]|nr:hypothetical protein [Acidobacteriota bacterium]
MIKRDDIGKTTLEAFPAPEPTPQAGGAGKGPPYRGTRNGLADEGADPDDAHTLRTTIISERIETYNRLRALAKLAEVDEFLGEKTTFPYTKQMPRGNG